MKKGPAIALFVIGGLAGLVFAGGLTSFVQHTNSLEFCISCHEMESTVYQEYKETAHFENVYGVRAVCSDCHVPHDNWIATLLRKARATTDELPNHFLGKIDTKEKFEAHRLELAERVWAEMKAHDSRECRSCHVQTAMLLSEQRKSVRTQHESGFKEGKTCIDCHKGVAHKDPRKQEEAPAEEQDFKL